MLLRPTLRASALAAASLLATSAFSTTFKDAGHAVQHVLLISIDGMHEADLAHMLKAMPESHLAKLAARSAVFSNAMTPIPSDSFPGLLALVTGGTARSHGMVYDDAYDSALAAPGSDCKEIGTELLLDEAIDKDDKALDAGGGIDETKLPRDPKNGCAALYPHQLMRANTIFEVIKAAGGRTAWSDKHPAYDIVHGPSGKGVDDLFTPEVAAGGTTDSVVKTVAYDDIKVAALLNQIAGRTSAGAAASVPVVMGMNFQAISVGQKTTGYVDAAGKPGPELTQALAHTDASIGKLLAALEAAKLTGNTLVVISAKHGQSPMDRSKLRIVDGKAFDAFVKANAPGGVAQVTRDDVAFIFLKDHKDAAAVAKALEAEAAKWSIAKVHVGATMMPWFNDPATDSRAPDIYVQPVDGVIYTSPKATKIAEHGGGAKEDRHVALFVAGPGVKAGVHAGEVTTMQVAPTILEALGLDASALSAVKNEGTKALPGLKF